MLTVKDAIQGTTLKAPFDIEYRFCIPEADIFDELFGFARWTGEELESLDGDSYDLDDEIINYSEVETTNGGQMLSVIFLSGTLTDDDIKAYAKEHGIPYHEESETEKELLEYMEETETEGSGKGKAQRRHDDVRKALRKKEISETHYGWAYYSNLHQYSKNKIHCSCPMCQSKTNAKKSKGKGLVPERQVEGKSANGTKIKSIPAGGMHWGSTNERFGKKNYKVSDKKKIQSLKEKEEEYLQGDLPDEE